MAENKLEQRGSGANMGLDRAGGAGRFKDAAALHRRRQSRFWPPVAWTGTAPLAAVVLVGSMACQAVRGAPPESTAPDKGVATDLKSKGAFGFPQVEAQVLCDNKDLRVCAWNDARHLYVQAVVWADNDKALGVTADGRAIGDSSALCLDIDGNQEETAFLDRTYQLNPWPSMPGLHYHVVVRPHAYTGLKRSSKGRGAIRYLYMAPGRLVRVDSYVIPLAEINKKPGEVIRLAYWASSPKPRLTLNSVGFEGEKYFAHALPMDRFHSVTLSTRPASLDVTKVPEGRSDPVPPRPVLKPVPTVGSVPPEVVAKDWINTDATPTLATLHGKVVLVDFWATWCGECTTGISRFNELHEMYEPKGFRVLSITEQTRDSIDDFNKKVPMKYAVGTGSNLTFAYGVTSIPHAFLIGKDGKVLWHGNPHPGGGLEKRIIAALEAP